MVLILDQSISIGMLGIGDQKCVSRREKPTNMKQYRQCSLKSLETFDLNRVECNGAPPERQQRHFYELHDWRLHICWHWKVLLGILRAREGVRIGQLALAQQDPGGAVGRVLNAGILRAPLWRERYE